MPRQLSRLQLIERSIHKKFRNSLWNPFIAAIKRYDLIAPGDRIGVCISGGKELHADGQALSGTAPPQRHPF